jgi:hypothetical protein
VIPELSDAIDAERLVELIIPSVLEETTKGAIFGIVGDI